MEVIASNPTATADPKGRLHRSVSRRGLSTSRYSDMFFFLVLFTVPVVMVSLGNTMAERDSHIKFTVDVFFLGYRPLQSSPLKELTKSRSHQSVLVPCAQSPVLRSATLQLLPLAVRVLSALLNALPPEVN